MQPALITSASRVEPGSEPPGTRQKVELRSASYEGPARRRMSPSAHRAGNALRVFRNLQ